jgi:hypothetical protein
VWLRSPVFRSDWQRVVGGRGFVLRIVEGGDRASRFLQPIDPIQSFDLVEQRLVIVHPGVVR